ncbi:MAG: DNA polymerase III subunit gamma/tau [Lachnospiraceae bacterium]|nr:DNA polymerase III subunit gamma/tau [Lachnospiraceae bacterium]MBQ5534625.1 DNA polymerase III subunit gamma/tau [Lachnospiraceae bacterium]
MSYQSLYRKYRPQRFSDVAGQEPVTTAIGNQIKSGRTGHAYLFTGTRGTGKTTVAKIFARAVNCETPLPDGSPCGECEMCRGIADGSLMNVIEIDAASNNGVDNVRTIIEEISYRPQKGNKKVYIIDEVHMLSPGAFNALLKTLEEPPDYVVFILATTEVGKVPVTILSRCQRYDFHRMPVDTLVSRMKTVLSAEGTQVEDKALSFVARQADGSMRDALSILDQCLAFNFEEVLTYDRTLEVLGAVDNTVLSRMMDHITGERLTDAIKLLDDTVMKGRDIQAFIGDFISYMRDLLLISAEGDTEADIADVLGVSTDNYDRMKDMAKKLDADTLIRFIRIFSELSAQIRYSSQKKILTEIAIVRLMHPEMQEDAASLRQRLAILERKIDRLEREGVKVSSAVQQGGSAPQAPAKKMPLPEALPEDVQMVCDNWGRIRSDATGSVKAVLAAAKPSTDGSKLVIVCESEVSADSLKSEADDLKAILERELKKEVTFEIYGPSKGEDPDTKYPDLEDHINFDVEINDKF